MASAQAQRIFRPARDAASTSAHVLAVVDEGTRGLRAVLAGTPYARTAPEPG